MENDTPAPAPARFLLVCPEVMAGDEFLYWDIGYACRFSGPIQYQGLPDHAYNTQAVWADNPENLKQLTCDTHRTNPSKVYQIHAYWQAHIETEFHRLFEITNGLYTRLSDPRTLHARWHRLAAA